MFVRIVKMGFDPLKIDEFLSDFEAVKHKIKALLNNLYIIDLKYINNILCL